MTSDTLKDLIGIRIEIDDPRGTAMGDRALIYFSQLFYECEIEQKWSFLSPNFSSEIPFQKKRAKKGTGDLREAKLVGDILHHNGDEWKKAYSGIARGVVTNKIEVQFVYTGNKNESGFNKHEIYDLKKILSAACRLMGSLTVSNIKIAVRETLKLLEENGKVANEKLSQLNEQSILLHLLYSKEEHGFLVPIRINGDLRFLTKDIYLDSFHALYRDYPKFETLNEEEFARFYKAAKVPVIKPAVV